MSDQPYDDLPPGWEWCTLRDVAQIGGEQIVPSRYPDHVFRYVALEHVEQGTGRLTVVSEVYGSEIKSNNFVFGPQHVLYGKLRPYLRKVLAPEFDGICTTELLPLEPDPLRLDRTYLLWWLLSPFVLDYVVSKQTGVKMPRLRTGDTERIPIPLPPLPEQRRIVEKIEALFEQSRTARAALEAIPPLIQQFRQSVLAAAFRGDLTERDPNDEPAWSLLERIGAEPLDDAELPELPEGWAWAELNPFIAFLQYGTSIKADATCETGIPVLRMGNIQKGYLDFTDLKYISPERENIAKYQLHPGDVLVNRTNSPELVGKSALFELEDTYVFASYIIRVQVEPSFLVPGYLANYINSPIGRDYIARVRHHVAGQSNINSSNIRGMSFPLCSPQEQYRIVERIESLLSEIAPLMGVIDSSRRRVDMLDQAVLARAFRGGLVPQDAEDEPASAVSSQV